MKQKSLAAALSCVSVLTALLIGALSPQALAADFQAGVEAYDRGEYAVALREFHPLAERGYTPAQLYLGGMYRRGDGVPQDGAEAAKWYRKAAEQGDADAQYSLGVMYAEGDGVPQDDAEAVRWYREAAEQGDADAQNNLGVMYAEGDGVPEDDAEAVRWYRKAAEQGDALAQFNLSLMYGRGDGVPKDYVQAYAWINIAAAQEGHQLAKEMIERLAESMTREEVSRAQQLAREYWKAYVEPFRD